MYRGWHEYYLTPKPQESWQGALWCGCTCQSNQPTRQEPCASSASGTSSSCARPPLFVYLLGFSGEHPISFGDDGRQFLETPSARNGDECLPKGRFLGTGEHQAPMSLLGKRKSMQREECQKRLRNRSASITVLGGPFESLAGFVLTNICKRLRMPSSPRTWTGSINTTSQGLLLSEESSAWVAWRPAARNGPGNAACVPSQAPRGRLEGLAQGGDTTGRVFPGMC